MILKILEDNQTKIAEICKNHVRKFKDTSSNADIDRVIGGLVETIETSLAEEASWVEREYSELLKKYADEQSMQSQSHSLTLMNLKRKLSLILERRGCVCKGEAANYLSNNVSAIFSNISCASLNNQSMVTSFGEPDVLKKMMHILAQVTLHLLHYYSVSQNYARKEESNLEEGKISPSPTHIHHRRTDNDEEKVAVSKKDFGACVISPLGNEESGNFSQNSQPVSFYNEITFEGCTLNEEPVSLTALDTTGTSEGMLEDIEKNEQVKEILTSSCPNLISVLKGKYEHISVPSLEREVQELTISLQAATGMLEIFLFSKEEQEISQMSSKTLTKESGLVPDLSQHPLSYSSEPENDSELIDNFPASSGAFKFSKNDLESFSNANHMQWEMDTDGLSKEFSSLSLHDTLNYTNIKPVAVYKDEKIEDLLNKLQEERIEKETLLKKIHQIQGLYAGLKDQMEILEKENCRLEDSSLKLGKDMQNTRSQLASAECRIKELEDSPSKLSKKLTPRDIKDKVRAVLAAKDKEKLQQAELIVRVGDLENILEEVVTEREKTLEILNLKVTDLTQQLEVADRQLRSSRQFLEQQATERDQELEELIKMNANLANQLKEKETLTNQQAVLQKEVRDLREIVQSLESQLASKCIENQSFQDQILNLTTELNEANSLAQDLNVQLETLKQHPSLNVVDRMAINDDSDCERPRTIHPVNEDRHKNETEEVGLSILEELENIHTKDDLSRVTQEYTMLQNIFERMEKSARGLEALQMFNVSGSAISDEELSIRDQLELTVGPNLENSRAMSPSSLERILEEKFFAFERNTEAAVKYTRDLEMRLKILKTEHDEVANERDELHQKLAGLSNLKGELEKASHEYNSIRADFEGHLITLKEKLAFSRQQLDGAIDEKNEIEKIKGEVEKEKEHLKSELKEKTKELEIFSAEMEGYKKNMKDLENKGQELVTRLHEMSTERDFLHRQNSEQLIKISGLEARLEDFRRADSPHDYEFRMRISSLQDELEKNRTELTHKYREIEELQYNIREIREKLVLREEELERTNLEPCIQPASLPESTVDQRLHQIQALQKEIQTLNEVIKGLNEKLGNCHETIPKVVLSDALFESLLEEKNADINRLNYRLKSAVRTNQEVLTMINDNYAKGDIVNVLKNELIDEERSWQSQLSYNSHEEIQRKEPLQQSPDALSNLAPHNFLRVESQVEGRTNSALSVSECSANTSLTASDSKLHMESFKVNEDQENRNIHSDVLQESKASQTDFGSLVSLVTDDDNLDGFVKVSRSDLENLTKNSDENIILKAQIGVLEQEIKGLAEYQKKLEEDFKCAQEMLESKEEEINMLTEEIEDCGTPLKGGDTQLYEEKINELLFENESLELQCQQYKNDLEAQTSEMNSLRESIPRGKVPEITQKESFTEEIREDLELTRNVEAVLGKEVEELQRANQELHEKVNEENAREAALKRDVDQLITDLKEERDMVSAQKVALLKRDQEICDLTSQIDKLMTQLRDAAAKNCKQVKTLEQQHYRAIEDMKEKNIEREKQLCNEYEERMASQVSDLSMKLSREREESIKHCRDYYESLISKIMEDKESALEQREKAVEELERALEEMDRAVEQKDRANEEMERAVKEKETALSEIRYITKGGRPLVRSGSVEDLQIQLRQELNNSANLDNTLFSYLEGIRNSDGKTVSRESSVVSEMNNTDEGESSIANRLQNLIRKVHREGVQVLSLAELVFLQSHQNQLNSSQQGIVKSIDIQGSFISSSDTTSMPMHDLTSFEARDVLTSGEDRDVLTAGADRAVQTAGKDWEDLTSSEGKDARVAMLSHIAFLEEQLNKKDQELKKKVHLLEFNAEQEKYLGEEWLEALEIEKQQTEQLRKKLNVERTRNFELATEVTQTKCQLQLIERQLHAAQEDLESLESKQATNENQIHELEEALFAERKNFSRVSTTLNQQRKLAATTSDHQNQLISELRSCLEKERNRVLNLVSQLHDLKAQVEDSEILNNSSIQRTIQNQTLFIDNELQMAVAVDNDRDLQRRFEECERTIRTLTDQLHSEKERYLTEISEEQVKVSQLRKMIARSDRQREIVSNEVQEKDDIIRQLKLQKEEVQKEASQLKTDLNIQQSTNQRVNTMAAQDNSEMQAAHAAALKNLRKKEMELIDIKKKLAKMEYELKLSREREGQLVQDLDVEKDAVNRLRIPAFSRIKNLSEFMEIQQRENIELCKSLTRLTDDRRILRQKIASLEGMVEELTHQLANREKYSLKKNMSNMDIHAAEREAFGAEKASLKLALRQTESKNLSLQNMLEGFMQQLDQYQRISPSSAQCNSLTPDPSIAVVNKEEARLQYLYWKYKRSESYRRALIWQKRYLMVVLEGYHNTEFHTLGRLATIASNVMGDSAAISIAKSTSILSPKAKFRSAVFVVVAVHRMNFMLKRWELTRKVVLTKTTISSEEPLPLRTGTASPQVFPHVQFAQTLNMGANNGRCLETEVGAAAQESKKRRVQDAPTVWPFTGFTPPTKDAAVEQEKNSLFSDSPRRNLFGISEDNQLNDYVKRLELIHSKLGLPIGVPTAKQ